MDRHYASEILSKLPGFKVAVVGDYCLDKYAHIDPSLNESSRETGKIAYQVTHVRLFPGAAGTVCANLASLGFGGVYCYGVTGDDGDGYELRRGLSALGCNCDHLLVTDRLTSTFLKPVDTDMNEMSRLDFRTRSPLSRSLEEELLGRLGKTIDQFNAVIILDQFDLPDEGLVSKYILEKLSAMAKSHPEILFYADSRARPGDFAGMTVKCNHLEAGLFAGLEPDSRNLPEIGRRLIQKTHKSAFITLGEHGIASVCERGVKRSPAFHIEGPLDIVGAGDAASSGIVSALCSGAPLQEAAFFANLVSSVTVTKIGVTGTASPDEIVRNAAMLEGVAALDL